MGRRAVVASLGAGLIALLSLAPAAAERESPRELMVQITPRGPNPRIATVRPGQTVTFRNVDRLGRRVVSLDGLFESGPLNGNQASGRHGGVASGTASVVFDQPGTYSYVASGRPRQSGKVVVRAARGSVPTPTPTPPRRTILRFNR